MNIHILQHEAFESPAAIENWIKTCGHQASYTRFYNFEKLPESIDSIDLLLVLGGPQSPSTTKDECSYFDVKAEIVFIKKAIEANKKVLGICLGAQLIGEALGAKVEHSPNREIGKYAIKLTNAGMNDPLTSLLPKIIEVGHWHGDMPGLTAESEILATSDGCPRQIVRYLPMVYGFQCHLEFTSDAIAEMIENCSDELVKFAEKPYIQTQKQLLENNYSDMNELLFKMLDKFSTMHLKL
jgi:GMP synthase (glutamine-hydrolysing)